MARIDFTEADKISNVNNGGGFFKLVNDGDYATVRFLIEDPEDIEALSYHEINLDGKKRKVSCLRELGEEKSTCPFCDNEDTELSKAYARYYIHLIEYEKDSKGEFTGEANHKIWDRGVSFKSWLQNLIKKYNNPSSYLLEITRNGVAGDTNTTYMFGNSSENGEDFPLLPGDWEHQEVLGTIVLDKNKEEMEYYLENGKFPEDKEEGVSRREVKSSKPTTPTASPQTKRPVGRRTRG